jgi:serine/threonine protein kinase
MNTMAPELVLGKEYTQSADIYSAGVIYNWLVTGKDINHSNTTENRQSA